MRAPFSPGDRVLHRSHPREAWIVTSYDAGNRMVRCASAAVPGYSDITESGPEEIYILAPEGWVDPPPPPLPKTRFGLSYEADEAAREDENTDPDFQRRKMAYHLAWSAWARDWLSRIDPIEGRHFTTLHLAWAECCQQLIDALAPAIAAE